jgi:hypothetical protein
MADVKFSQFTVGNEMQVGDLPVGLRPSSPTLNFQFNFPGTGIKDSSGNYLFQYGSAGALSVNNLQFFNSITGTPVTISSVGSDMNIPISILTKGTGALFLNNLRWPLTDGTAGQVLTTDGTGDLSFAAVAGAISSVTGTVNQVLVNGTTGVPQTGAITLTLPQDIAPASSPSFNTVKAGYTTTATSATTTTLTAGSTYQQFFTGATTQTVLMPVTSTLALGQSYYVVNNSTGSVTLQSSGANAIQVMAANTFAILTCILTSGTTAASWNSEYSANGGGSGTVNFGSANQLAYYAAGGTAVSGFATTPSSVLVSNSAGLAVPIWQAVTNGQLIIGSTGATPAAATLTAGANIGIVNAAGSITISATGMAAFAWNVVTGTTQAMLSNNGYITNNAGLVTLTLPAASAVGDEIDVVGKGLGGWKIQAGAGQTIILGSASSTSGGSLASTNAKDSLYIVCTVSNTEWQVASAPQGNITVA